MTIQTLRRMTAITATAILLPTLCSAQAAEESGNGRWSISAMGGWINYEGDEPVKDAAAGTLSLGYDLSRRWTLEGVIEYTPDLKSTYRRDWATGERISRMSEGAGRDLTETSAIRFALDGLLHLAPGRRFDPYLAAGIGIATYEDDFDARSEPLLRAGGGLFANISRHWAIRLDSRVVLAGTDTEANLLATAGLVFRPGAGSRRPAAATAVPPSAEEVKMFVLNLNFDPGKWEIKSEYRSELDVVGRFLDTRSRSTARIEGHEKETEGTEEDAARSLSEKRAAAVRDYLRDNWKIRASRMSTEGFGTSRPVSIPGQGSERIEVTVTAP